MTRTDEAAMSALPDGTLHHMRATYEAETAWLPPHVGAELRQVRQGRTAGLEHALLVAAEGGDPSALGQLINQVTARLTGRQQHINAKASKCSGSAS